MGEGCKRFGSNPNWGGGYYYGVDYGCLVGIVP